MLNLLLDTIEETAFFPERRVIVALTVVVGLSIVTGLAAWGRKFLPVPLLWMLLDLCFGKLGDRLDRLHRPAPDLFFRGFLLAIVALVAVVALFAGAAYVWPFPAQPALWEAFVLCVLISAPSTTALLLRLYQTFGAKKAGQGAYLALARAARVDYSGADDSAITRGALAMSAQRLSDALIAPLFWYGVAGLEGALLHASFTALAWRYGAAGFGRAFGLFAYGTAFALNVIPSALSAALIWIAAFFTPGARKRVLPHLYAQGHVGGASVTALAYALGVTLGGSARSLSGDVIKAPWVGPEGASAKVAPAHLKRAVYLLLVVQLLLILALCGVYLLFASNL